jgi:molecular chaperone DnaK (HSP70)
MTDEASLHEVHIVNNWGHDMTNDNKIPSVYSYSPTSTAHQQWGTSLSPEAVAMVNTKMELEVQDNKLDELELLLQVLDGTCDLSIENVKRCQGNPEYTWKQPEEIVTDYMTNVFKYVNGVVEDMGDHLRANIPVDIVITVPVRWSYRAQNSTLRAIRTAGFNEQTFPNLVSIMMVAEPEAAAIYTARYLKEDKRTEFLKASFRLRFLGGILHYK